MLNRVFLQCQPRHWAQGDVKIHGHCVLAHLLQHGKLIAGEPGIGGRWEVDGGWEVVFSSLE